MLFLCYKCHKFITNGSPDFYNIFCKAPFRNHYNGNNNINYHYNNYKHLDNWNKNRNNFYINRPNYNFINNRNYRYSYYNRSYNNNCNNNRSHSHYYKYNRNNNKCSKWDNLRNYNIVESVTNRILDMINKKELDYKNTHINPIK